MVHSSTSFGKLKSIIVGNELCIPTRMVDITFKYFYKEALGQGLYNSAISEYKINQSILDKRRQQLDALASTLAHLGVVVYRPCELKKMHKIKTPYFESEASPANNVRDLTLVYNDTIVETPCFVRNRYFENMNLAQIFSKVWHGGRWIKAPNTQLSESSIDIGPWNEKRDFSKIDERYEMAIDGAQFLRIGKDVIVNVSTFNHYLGYEWVKSLFPESSFWLLTCCDNHIDGMIVCLKPGMFLANPLFKKYEAQLPEKFKSWKIIYPDEFIARSTIGMSDVDIQLASSRGMDINVLSIDENTVLVNKKAYSVIKCLENEGFTVVQIELDYCELFAGGIHCSTLDLERDDEYIYYA